MKWKIYLSALFCLSATHPALAHGVSVEYRQTAAIEIRAAFDGGEPMADAQVTVYAPDDPTAPWLQGSTDEMGHFAFVPDRSLSGNWDVRVRKSGHGDIISIPLEATQEGEPMTTTPWESARGGYTTVQKVTMAAIGVWGLVGTALFFARKKEKSAAD